MPMIAKISPVAKKVTQGKKQYRSPIGPDKDPGTQASKMRKFGAAYEAAFEAGNQGTSAESRKELLKTHLKSAEGTPGGKNAVLEGMIEGTKASLAGDKNNLKKVRTQAKRATKAYLG